MLVTRLQIFSYKCLDINQLNIASTVLSWQKCNILISNYSDFQNLTIEIMLNLR